MARDRTGRRRDAEQTGGIVRRPSDRGAPGPAMPTDRGHRRTDPSGDRRDGHLVERRSIGPVAVTRIARATIDRARNARGRIAAASRAPGGIAMTALAMTALAMTALAMTA